MMSMYTVALNYNCTKGCRLFLLAFSSLGRLMVQQIGYLSLGNICLEPLVWSRGGAPTAGAGHAFVCKGLTFLLEAYW